MNNSGGWTEGLSEATEIEWRVASVDTVLFGLLDQLHRDKQRMTARDGQPPSASARGLARRPVHVIAEAIAVLYRAAHGAVKPG